MCSMTCRSKSSTWSQTPGRILLSELCGYSDATATTLSTAPGPHRRTRTRHTTLAPIPVCSGPERRRRAGPMPWRQSVCRSGVRVGRRVVPREDPTWRRLPRHRPQAPVGFLFLMPHRPAGGPAAGSAPPGPPRPKTGSNAGNHPLRSRRHFCGAPRDRASQGSTCANEGLLAGNDAGGAQPPPAKVPFSLVRTCVIDPFSGPVPAGAVKTETSIRARDAAPVSALVTSLWPGRRWPRASERSSGRPGSQAACPVRASEHRGRPPPPPGPSPQVRALPRAVRFKGRRPDPAVIPRA